MSGGFTPNEGSFPHQEGRTEAPRPPADLVQTDLLLGLDLCARHGARVLPGTALPPRGRAARRCGGELGGVGAASRAVLPGRGVGGEEAGGVWC